MLFGSVSGNACQRKNLHCSGLGPGGRCDLRCRYPYPGHPPGPSDHVRCLGRSTESKTQESTGDEDDRDTSATTHLFSLLHRSPWPEISATSEGCNVTYCGSPTRCSISANIVSERSGS